MSKIAFCETGQKSGILTTHQEMQYLNFLMYKEDYLYVPLPDIKQPEQLTRIRKSKCTHEDGEQYWEIQETGQGGWCCKYCGQITENQKTNGTATTDGTAQPGKA